MSKIFLLDTMNFIFRSYYAVPATLTNAAGMKTNALVGVYKALQHLVRAQGVTHCVAALESTKPNFREELDSSYKANRSPAPEDLKAQIPFVIDMCSHLGIKTLSIDGYEADDVMASLAQKFSGQGHEVVIVSNDKDLAQVTRLPRVAVLHVKSKGEFQLLKGEDIPTEYGVTAEQIPAWLALMGDTSDNIVGIKGLGAKTVAKLLGAHTLEELLSEPSCDKRWGEKISAAREQVLHNLQMATIACDAPLPEGFEADEVAFAALDVEKAREFFVALGMKQAVSDFDNMLPPQPTVADLWL